MERIIDMNGVSWIREKRSILKEITWRVEKGEHWAILGLNGSGKTSLLNLINGYIWPTKGEMTVLGKKFGEADLHELRQSIGWVSSSLLARIDGWEPAQNVVVSGKFASIGLYEPPSPEEMESAYSLMEKLGCRSLINRAYGTCSQGEQQRLLIARALMSNPKLLILDEPTNGLDLFAREELLRTIQTFAEDPHGPTLLYVTHQSEEILPLFNKTLLLRNGEVFRAGNTRDLLNEETLSRFFAHPIEVEKREGRTWIRPIQRGE